MFWNGFFLLRRGSEGFLELLWITKPEHFADQLEYLLDAEMASKSYVISHDALFFLIMHQEDALLTIQHCDQFNHLVRSVWGWRWRLMQLTSSERSVSHYEWKLWSTASGWSDLSCQFLQSWLWRVEDWKYSYKCLILNLPRASHKNKGKYVTTRCFFQSKHSVDMIWNPTAWGVTSRLVWWLLHWKSRCSQLSWTARAWFGPCKVKVLDIASRVLEYKSSLKMS